ncbi:MAG: sigma 54-interacting transcriptional regulator [Propionicimonas sp.]|uniref:sigma 54-interacting transcriptional regulator n=1 Tax=Propionicimonas sp. TaxID=1955623 RepID=UPI002B1FDED2|nr:sigma 54-interacting transcriptional regulator [Propionicimonas sp.]MEA4945457.1 sigma 54-interacting transcriptional regulator [Propionicimonas sp.]
MAAQTRTDVLEYLITQTQALDLTVRDALHADLSAFTTNVICRRLNISRNLASQYLNDLVKERVVFKITTRPVYFLHRATVEHACGAPLKNLTYYSMDEFFGEINSDSFKRWDFRKAIGWNDSLSYAVEQCKSAMKYPPSGLPVLIVGASGTGKSLFARLMYEYAVNNSLLGRNSPFEVLNCSEFANDPDGMARRIFGDPDAPGGAIEGLLQRAHGGVLFFDEAHNLSRECQERLFAFIDDARIDLPGRERKARANVRLILATTQAPEEAFLQTLLRRIPIVARLPEIAARTRDEKDDLINHFFRQEGYGMGVGIRFSHRVLEALENYAFPGNVGELKNAIRTGCASAFFEQGRTDLLTIKLYHLPANLLTVGAAVGDGTEPEDEFILLREFGRSGTSDRILDFLDDVWDAFEGCEARHTSLDSFLEQCFAHLNSFYDYIVFDSGDTNARVQAIGQVLNGIFEDVSEKYGIFVPTNCVLTLSRCLCSITQVNSALRQWATARNADLTRLLGFLEERMPVECAVADDAARRVMQSLDMRPGAIEKLLLVLNVKYYNRTIRVNDTTAFVVSHGYSTASSIADSVNKMLAKPVFHSIDMPLDVSPADIAVRLRKRLELDPAIKNAVILVDMGSLEQLGEQLQSVSGVCLGIANNTSTRMALEVGNRILQGVPIDEMLKGACENVRSSYRLFVNELRKPAVVFTSEMGVTAAERMLDLFSSSLPAGVNLSLTTCDYDRLVELGDECEVLKRYKVLCVVGSFNPGLKRTHFVSLDTLVTSSDHGVISQLLAPYVSERDATELAENLMKEFSLSNVVESLTILNADKLLDHVVEAVKRLQTALGKQLSGKTIVGIYVHICCLIERLVTKSTIDRSEVGEAFARSHPEFIAQVNASFREISEHYRVSLPASECYFLHEYVLHSDDV